MEKTKTNVYQMVTERIVEQLQQGIIPWHKPWASFGEAGEAINYVTRKPYSMLNQMLLCREGEYLTYKQLQQAGGKLKKGAKSSVVVFYTTIQDWKKTETNENGEEYEVQVHSSRKIPVLRYYRVFHIEDCEGVTSKLQPVSKPNAHVEPIAAAESVVERYISSADSPAFQNDKPSNQAYYSPKKDLVVVPMLEQYNDVKEEYYSTTFHELVHSTMTESRCNRKSEGAEAAFFGSENYSREELVAEIGAAMLCNHAGLDCEKAFRNSVAYIQGWLKNLQHDNKAIVWAAAKAEKAARFILGENTNNNTNN